MQELISKFLSIKKSTLLSYGITAVAVVLAFCKWTGRLSNNSFTDYFSANSLYSKWHSSTDESAFKEFKALLGRRSDLHGRFDALIAQRLLEKWKAENAQVYAQPVIARTSGFSPAYKRFSQISFQIAQKEYKTALNESKKLKEELAASSPSLLQSYNLMRIAFLEEQVGNSQDEKAAWDELSKSPFLPVLQESIHQQDLSLKDYIQFRKSMI